MKPTKRKKSTPGNSRQQRKKNQGIRSLPQIHLVYVAYFLYHMRVIYRTLAPSCANPGPSKLTLVCLIFFCSWKMPYMSASLVGGQPGT